MISPYGAALVPGLERDVVDGAQAAFTYVKVTVTTMRPPGPESAQCAAPAA